jgi:hypothetical protein
MDRTDPRIRKRLMNEQSSTSPETPGEIDIASHATLAYSSEDPDHPLEHLVHDPPMPNSMSIPQGGE